MRDLNHDFKRLAERNRDGAFQTQHDREVILSMVADQLAEGGFLHLRAPGLKPKHVEHLVRRWHAEGIAAGTFKNRMAALRWLAEKISKQNIVARDNAAYGIADRCHVSNSSKATVLDAERLASVTDPYTAMALRLQAAFGLRREESIKLRPLRISAIVDAHFRLIVDGKTVLPWAAPGRRTGTGLTVAESSTISLKRPGVVPVSGLVSGPT